MSDAFGPALDALRQQLAREEQAVVETKKLINKLSSVAGLDAPFLDMEEATANSVTAIRSDTFYGKRLHKAVREYLEMRKASGQGPAETREIYEALCRGGYQFDAADANNAMTGMRSLMRKNSAVFHRLPNNTWGLTSWYEAIRTSKTASSRLSSTADEDSEESETADVEPPAVRLLDPPA